MSSPPSSKEPTLTDALKAHHAKQAAKAAELYFESRTPPREAKAWHDALSDARKRISSALTASDMLDNVAAALHSDGRHMLVFRHLLAPPISQDQFSILCPKWNKATEKNAAKVPQEIGADVARTFGERRSKQLIPWLDKGIGPTSEEVQVLLSSVAPLMASQAVNTLLRNQFAKEQENAVIAFLDKAGWKRIASKLIDTRAALGTRQYMHKTRFATNTVRPQEVDIACGLKGTYVLAMECKVTNDVTNSVKRINDVLKKAHAWKTHWGSFVETAALLQGVIAAKEVARLIDGDVHVFWSHDLKAFETWLDGRT